MSSLRRSSLVLLARASVVSSMLLALGCSGDATADGPAFTGPPAAPPTSSVSDEGTPDHTAYPVVPGSRARAQKLLVDAEEAFISAPSGHYDVAWVGSDVRTTPVRGEFDLAVPAGRLVFHAGEGALQTLLIKGDSWSRPKVDGENAFCWMHFSRGTSEIARMSAVLPGAYPLLDPRAVGFLEGGRESQVVIDLLLDEAVPITAPKLANQPGKTIDPEATIRGVMTLEAGQYRSLEYEMADALAELERSNPSMVEGLRKDMGTAPKPWTVKVTYSSFGTPVTVAPPPPASVIDLGDPDQFLSLSPDERPTGRLPTCEAQR